MKSYKKYAIIFLIIPALTIPILNTNLSSSNSFQPTFSTHLFPQIATTYNNTVEINDLPGNPQNWTWAKDQGICTGSGTESDPYVIKNHFFDTRQFSITGLHILNSRKYFRIEHCLFNTSDNYASIRIVNSTNGYISENTGFPDIGAFIWLLNSSYNVVINNNASYCHIYGILIDDLSHHNSILKNVISQNLLIGIYFSMGANLNTIEDNSISSTETGIFLQTSCNYNIIKGNHVSNCSNVGITVDSSADNNTFYMNCIFNNTLNAEDSGNNNTWDFSGKGNYWDDYNGTDINNDGIGDIPYNITGPAGSSDHFPLMVCPAPSNPSGIPGYELPLVFTAILLSWISLIYIGFKKKKFKF